jgi:hypothetical protein
MRLTSMAALAAASPTSVLGGFSGPTCGGQHGANVRRASQFVDPSQLTGDEGKDLCPAWPMDKYLAGRSLSAPLPVVDRLPVMLIPPMTGSYMDSMKVNAPNQPSFLCSASEAWRQVWPPSGAWDLAPLYSDCWGFDITLKYNASADTSGPLPGVTTRVNMSLDTM